MLRAPYSLFLLAILGCSPSQAKTEVTPGGDGLMEDHMSDSGFCVVINGEEIACEHPERKRESVRWEDVRRIWYVTTSAGPWLPDEWLLFEGRSSGCSVPTEAQGFDKVFDEIKVRFPGFDYEPLIQGGTEDARYLCWERRD
jgi:hypothetical protein